MPVVAVDRYGVSYVILTFLVPVASGYTLTGRYTLVSLPVTFACLPGKGGCAETARLVA